MHPDLIAFREKFRVSELSIVHNNSWTWSVRPGQPTLGSSIISLNRYALELGDVSNSEMADFSDICAQLESVLKTEFNYQIMNYLALMMVDRHVHFHVIPRYDSQRVFAKYEWVDNGWPALPILSDSQHAGDNELLTKIQDRLNATL